jgi:xylose isomerase
LAGGVNRPNARGDRTARCGMDVIARALLRAAKLIEDGALAQFVADRYAAWDTGLGSAILAGERSLIDLKAHVLQRGTEPRTVSGPQEMLENLVNRSA